MERIRGLRQVQTLVEAELSEVIAKRLVGYVAGTETAGVHQALKFPRGTSSHRQKHRPANRSIMFLTRTRRLL